MLAKAGIDNDLRLTVNPEIVGFGWGKMSQRIDAGIAIPSWELRSKPTCVTFPTASGDLIPKSDTTTLLFGPLEG